MQPPSAIGQLASLVLLVLPGLTCQFLWGRRRGPVAGEAQLGERGLRAITAGMALNGAYAIVAGPALASARRAGLVVVTAGGREPYELPACR
ncbi:DUF6338 family protein [Streptomyces sp. YGL11-2]|uniref:DUF6338 family protein n=1 Tax=Streptomyces sp. YGL11-2 TaxID=3414028 RepID=UPI003CF0FD64